MGMVLLVCAALFVGCAAGDPKLAEALENIQNPDEAFRLPGINTLSSMGEKAKPHADKVAALLKDDSAEMRGLAISLLGQLKHSSPEIVQELGAMATGDKDNGVRANALETLAQLGAQDEFAKAGKAILAGDDDTAFKGETIMIIEQSGAGSVTALKAELEAIAGGSDEDLADAAKRALKSLEQ